MKNCILPEQSTIFYSRNHENRRFYEYIHLKPSSNFFLIKIDDRGRQTALSFRLMTEREFKHNEDSENLFYNLYFGGLIFIGVFSLIIGYILRFTVFYTYGLYALVMAFFMFINIGFGFKYLHPQQPEVKRFLDVIMVIPLLASFLFFSTSYFNLKKENPLHYRFVLFIFGLYGLALIFLGIYPARLSMIQYIFLNYFLITATYVILTIIALKALVRNRVKALFFLSAFAVLAISGVLFAMIDASIIPHDWVFTNPLL
ncbi:MAG: 7TM-DISM domain-containing protein, partial [Bacteroidales bacterium]|nr:7TM-DISM domain-containing protein [Bacteroidales bacterium]